MILTADLHLTDAPADEYRWQVFDALRKLLPKHGPVHILGDLTDRKDRHSAALVNRLVSELNTLQAHVFILMGNHDKPLNGTPFWQFLNELSHEKGPWTRHFITKPRAEGKDLLLLPYSANPREDWEGIPIGRYRAAFLHQTITGAVGNNGIALENKNMPLLPRGVKYYAGDIHTPQIVGRVTYVGAPHPVAFGDDYPCRMLLLDDGYAIAEEINLSPPKKHMIRVASLAELEATNTHRGDQARVIFKLSLHEIDAWPSIQDAIASWASKRGVSIASVEPDITTTSALSEEREETSTFDLDPASVLREFALAEGIDDSMLTAGLSLLEESK